MRIPGRGYPFLCALAIMVAVVPAAGCAASASQTPAGTSLAPEGQISIGAKPVPPGTELGMLYVVALNQTRDPLTFKSVTVPGQGIGTVVKVVEIRMAPIAVGRGNQIPLDTVGASLYGSNPPVDGFGTPLRCHKQTLKPVLDFVLKAKTAANIWIVIRAIRPGTYNIPVHVVTYTEKGVLYRQVLTMHAYGAVADNARGPTQEPDVNACIKPTGAKVLSGYTAPAR